MNRSDLRGWLKSTKTSNTARLVYLALALHADGSNRAWPSTTTIAAQTGLGKSTVRATLRELEWAGDISPRFVEGRPTVYTLSPYPAISWQGTPPDNGGLVRQDTAATPPDDGPDPASSWRQKNLTTKDELKGGSGAPPRNGAAARTAAPSPVVTRPDGATFLPGTGWVQ